MRDRAAVCPPRSVCVARSMLRSEHRAKVHLFGLIERVTEGLISLGLEQMLPFGEQYLCCAGLRRLTA